MFSFPGKFASGIVLALLLTTVLLLASRIQPAKASGTIYIRADGSIDPPTAPIQRNGDVYTLIGNITSDDNGIVIERDDMTLDGSGYTLRGPEEVDYVGNGNGTYLAGRKNISITYLHITDFFTGIMLDESSNCTLLNNVMESNDYGIWLARSPNNNIIRNRLTGNGIHFWPSSNDNRIVENNIVNDYGGITIYGTRIYIYNNTITNSSYGITLVYASSNTISNNAFSNAGLRIHGGYENVVESNTVNGKPLVYFEKASDHIVEDAGQVILVNCSNIRVKNLNLSRTSYPIQLWETNNSRIANNSITANNWNGIQLYFSSNNTLEGNNVTGNLYHGIHFHSSSHNILRNNVLSVDRYFNFFVDGSDLSHFIHDIDTSNIVNGKPIYYWINKKETAVPPDAGYVALVNCTHMTVQNLTFTKNAQAIVLAFTTNSTVTQNNLTKNEYDIFLYASQGNSITRNTMTNDWYGVYLHNSLNNTIQENTIMWTNYFGIAAFNASHNCIVKNTIAAWYCIRLESSSSNLIYHNDFVGNTPHHFFTRDSVNVWDNGYPSGGNYWSDHIDTDIYSGPNQNATCSDGIGDTPYGIDENNTDNYPLMKPYGGSHDVGIINVKTSKTVIGQGSKLRINVSILNYGNNTETFNLTAYANTAAIASENVTLESRNSTTLTFTWNTTDVTKGNYTITANATILTGETDTADNNFTDGWTIVAMVGDITGPEGWPDGKVDMRDIGLVARYFGEKTPPAPPNCDVVYDLKIDMRDIGLVARHFGETDP